MRCPKCAHSDDKVVDSRAIRNGAVIRRRRVCTHCGHRFSTYEEVIKSSLIVLKRDGRREDFDRAKLRHSLVLAVIKRPISDPQLDQIADEVAHELDAEYAREVPSTVIGRKALDKLEKLDEVAFLRFASVYRRFRNASQFLSEIENLIGRQ
ncbi:MAG: transcriptional regulator NrdR [Kiritimatiellae bacterium]|jgi:transcriptional repressor NrdR|nr:transcriptional regulator NrdR [Kiritimatiellia bacterium]MDD4342700.1 transcriptional regulator NrdR [Kiritimatiellia bacterium]MDY0148453.1 transcriptional regulator NrdR [Kiritimatiellia bacterium]